MYMRLYGCCGKASCGNGEGEVMGDDFRPIISIILTIILVVIIRECGILPTADKPFEWIYWVGFMVLAVWNYFAVDWLFNYFVLYKDEVNIKCRIFGHSNKNMGKRIKLLCPVKQPFDEFEYTLYQCKRCGHQSDGGMYHNITAEARCKARDWKIKLF